MIKTAVRWGGPLRGGVVVKFSATLLQAGKTATGIEFPPDLLEALGGGKRPLITVTINGHTYPSAVGSMDGKAMIPVSAANRAAAGIAAGDTIEVTVELDTAPREVDVPAALAEALAANPAAKAAFDGLSNSAKKRHTLSVEGAKTDETRQRRVAKAIADLAG